MSKPENTFIRGVHKHLPVSIYHEKMNNPFRAGTPDVWYSGPGSDLWVEYKYLQRIPKKAEITADLSPRQLQWLNARYDQGRNVAVIVGSPEGGIVLENGAWEHSFCPVAFRSMLLSRQELAGWITDKVTHGFPRSIV